MDARTGDRLSQGGTKKNKKKTENLREEHKLGGKNTTQDITLVLAQTTCRLIWHWSAAAASLRKT